MQRLGRSLTNCLTLVAALPVLFGLFSFGPHSAQASPLSPGWPDSMASTGDSITRAYNTGSVAFTDAPANSWSTGDNLSVISHYSRILAVHPGINGRNYNDAVTAAKMVGLKSQILNVNAQHVDYVTVLLGANDACAATEAQMTPVDNFRAQFQAALAALSAGSPDARVYVMSVPNIYNLWNILHNTFSARTTWSLFGICQSMLANASSTAQADVDRRNRVNQRVVDYNTQLAAVCAAYIRCRFDNNAVFNTVFVPADVSTRDYFHPSLTGQAKIAATSYAAGFDFTDATPPVSQALSPQWPPRTVVISATDNAGVAGIEYRVDNGPVTRYVGPSITIEPGSVVLYHAIDVNGNAEAWHSIGSSNP